MRRRIKDFIDISEYTSALIHLFSAISVSSATACPRTVTPSSTAATRCSAAVDHHLLPRDSFRGRAELEAKYADEPEDPTIEELEAQARRGPVRAWESQRLVGAGHAVLDPFGVLPETFTIGQAGLDARHVVAVQPGRWRSTNASASDCDVLKIAGGLARRARSCLANGRSSRRERRRGGRRSSTTVRRMRLALGGMQHRIDGEDAYDHLLQGTAAPHTVAAASSAPVAGEARRAIPRFPNSTVRRARMT